jgi:uncharacterized membrane protein YjjP (DUF1212 family)
MEGRAGVVLTAARVLYINGQSTDQVLTSAKTLGRALGLRVEIMPRLGELQLKAQDCASGSTLISVVAADPTGVAMDRLASAMRTVEDIAAGRLAPTAAKEAIREASRPCSQELSARWRFDPS